jgi:hypothetical protein
MDGIFCTPVHFSCCDFRETSGTCALHTQKRLHYHANSVSNPPPEPVLGSHKVAARKMKSAFEYRSYQVSNEAGFYIAKSLDGEPGQLVSKYLLRVLRSIDVLWDTLGGTSMPSWCQTYLKGNTLHCDLDLFSDSLAPNLEPQCAIDSKDDSWETTHKFFPDSAKPALKVVAAA